MYRVTGQGRTGLGWGLQYGLQIQGSTLRVKPLIGNEGEGVAGAVQRTTRWGVVR